VHYNDGRTRGAMKATVLLEPNEILRFAVAVGLAPLVAVLARKLRLSSARWPFFAMYSAIATSYLMTILGSAFAPDLFNLLEHASSAVGAIAFALAARAFRRDVAKTRGGAA
jgi:ABC-type Na+ efflux pump permease subunit